jgi:radical SAM protein with 4Fe4S-binding SPASM domain
VEASIIITYRCSHRCTMCGTWRHPSAPESEFEPRLLEKLPRLAFANITGGEPLLREDLDEIAAILKRKARRVVISTNGFFTDRILDLAVRVKGLGFRISLEGLREANDELRGVPGGFDRGMATLEGLRRLGLRDIGFGITVSDRNAADLPKLHALARSLGFEFATAVVHNSFYFHKSDNVLRDPERVAAAFESLAEDMLATGSLKSWYRAYFNLGLAGYARGRPRPLPCGAGTDTFFLDPFGEILPCNGMEEAVWFESMGNLRESAFREVWTSEKACRVRAKVAACPKNCWMIGTAGPAMKSRLVSVSRTVLGLKLRTIVRRRTRKARG